ncbi:MAG: hypothetical protein QOE35_4118 [Actinomycetota bacterium]|jgi:hypothetical protein
MSDQRVQRRRKHVAGDARAVTAAISVSALLGLTGGLAIANAAGVTPVASAATPAATQATIKTTTPTGATSAQSGTSSATTRSADTSSHGS